MIKIGRWHSQALWIRMPGPSGKTVAYKFGQFHCAADRKFHHKDAVVTNRGRAQAHGIEVHTVHDRPSSKPTADPPPRPAKKLIRKLRMRPSHLGYYQFM